MMRESGSIQPSSDLLCGGRFPPVSSRLLSVASALNTVALCGRGAFSGEESEKRISRGVWCVSDLQHLLFQLLHLRQIELAEQVGHEPLPFPARPVVAVHFRQASVAVEVTVAAVAVLHVAVGCGVAAVCGVGLFWELEALDAGDGEGQVGPRSVNAVRQADVVGQLLPQVVLLLALALQGVQRFFQLALRDLLQAQSIFQLAVEQDRLLLQDLDFMF